MFQNRYSMFSNIRQDCCSQRGCSCKHVSFLVLANSVNDGVGKYQEVAHCSDVWAMMQCVIMCLCYSCWHSNRSVASCVLHQFDYHCRLHYIHQEKTTRYVNTSPPKTFWIEALLFSHCVWFSIDFYLCVVITFIMIIMYHCFIQAFLGGENPPPKFPVPQKNISAECKITLYIVNIFCIFRVNFWKKILLASLAIM